MMKQYNNINNNTILTTIVVCGYCFFFFFFINHLNKHTNHRIQITMKHDHHHYNLTTIAVMLSVLPRFNASSTNARAIKLNFSSALPF